MIPDFLSNKIIGLIGLVYLLLLGTTLFKINYSNSNIIPIKSDGKGYYDYLPALLIRGTFGNEPADHRYIIETQHGNLSRYSAGTALAIAPFFLVAVAYYELTNQKYTGYEVGFGNAVLCAAWFFFMIGMICTSNILKYYTRSREAVGITLLMVAFATNLPVYVFEAPTFSHVYSFAAIGAFVLSLRLFIEHGKNKHLLFAAFLLGIVVLIRPFNGLVVLAIPLIAGSAYGFLNLLKNVFQRPLLLILSILIFAGTAGLQQLLWYVQTGNWVLWGYGDDGFYFNKPEFGEVLFGFRKGLFMYTPVMLLVVISAFLIIKKKTYEAISYLGFFIALTYFISAWWMWYYGPSFSQRPYVDFYSVLFIPFALTGGSLTFSRTKKILFAISIAALIGFNVIQCYQYATGILDVSDMNFERYRAVFLKTDARYRYQFGGCYDIEPFHKERLLLFETADDFSGKTSAFHTEILSTDPLNEANTVSDYRNREFNTVLRTTLDSISNMRRMVFLDVAFHLLQCDSISAEQDALLIVEVRDTTGALHWYGATKLTPRPWTKVHQWQQINYGITFNYYNKGDILSVYVWNPFQQCVLIDNMELKLYAYRN